ncbi:MAG: FAD-dependent oxidoreductase [Planctomycetaceae bacterium]|nr:FAD-dependent oxidoreductase [Planctomycetaceae bacterium]
MDMDVVIFGGGAAGLWLLDELTRRRTNAVLLEANALGTGQTVAAQGIIHGGLKYTLQGLLTNSATSIREMPAIWRECLDGQREPNLQAVRRRSDECFLWRTDSLSSRLGMLGAQFGLRVAPQSVSAADRPEILQGCPGTVARLPEQVISSISLIEVLAIRNRERLLKVDPARVEFDCGTPGEVASIRIGDDIKLQPRAVVFTAGTGNSALRRSVGLTGEAMQRRPLHMVMLRGGRLPMFQGHCVDGAKTRVTITSEVDSLGRTVWQVGGQIAEDGVAWDERTLLTRARDELRAVLPNIDLSSVEWSTYRVDRAEGIVPGGKRPESVQIRREGNCLTAWPTKLALVPQLVTELVEQMAAANLKSQISNLKFEISNLKSEMASTNLPHDWPRPMVALPPWETAACWLTNENLAAPPQPAALPRAA